MIKVNRIKEPELFKDSLLKSLNTEIRHFYEQPVKKRQQKYFLTSLEYDFTSRLLPILNDLFHNKCAFCETSNAGLIDRFRPVRGASNQNGEVSLEHYWWLSYTWENLYLICPTCNKFKSNLFPVDGKRARPEENIKSIKERYLLVDPCNDEPDEHFDYDSEGRIMGKSEQGNVTLDVFKLNRSELVRGRKIALEEEKNRLNELRKLINRTGNAKILSDFRGYYMEILNNASRNQYLGIRVDFISKHILSNQRIVSRLFAGSPNIILPQRKEKTKKHYKFKPHPKLRSTVISKIEINNFKNIKNLVLDFGPPQINGNKSPWVVLLGENAVGKTSILQALGLGLSGQKYIDKLSKHLKPEELIRNNHNHKTAEIKIWLYGEEIPSTITIKESGIKSSDKECPVYLIGYGSIRPFPDGIIKHEKNQGYVKLKNLFKHYVTLNDPSIWLLEQEDEVFEKVAKRLKLALGLGQEFDLVRKDNKIKLQTHTGLVNIDQLSDGYKSSIALIVDIMSTMVSESADYGDLKGIVLLDELEVHLHPRWKMKVVNSLREAFPNLTFIATTHDPLCLKGLEEGEIIVLRRMRGGELQIIKDLPSTKALTAQQLLTSDFFGLNSTNDAVTNAEIERYYELLAEPNLNQPEKSELENLRKFVNENTRIGDSYREMLYYQIIDKLISQEKISGTKVQKSLLDSDVYERFQKLIKKSKQ